MSKQLLECTTLTVSVHRVKSPVRACGYINPKGFARGGRTIAGTMILTQFISFMAADFTPLLPLNETPVFNPNISGVTSFTTGQAYQPERTVSDIINKGTPCHPPTYIPAPEAHFR